MATAVELLSLEEFMALPETEMRQELDEGVLIEMAPAKNLHNKTQRRIFLAFHSAAAEGGEVEVYFEHACRLSDDPPTVRMPDVAILSKQQDEAGDDEGYTVRAPLAAVEVMSSYKVSDVLRKTRQYLAAGSTAVVLVHPELREIHVHREGASIEILRGADALSLPEVLPGWSMPADELLGS